MAVPQKSLQTLVHDASQLQRAGRFMEAIPHYAEALKLSPNNHQLLAALGVCQTCIDRAAEGRKNLEQAIRLAPAEARYHHNIAYTWKREGNFERAHACFDTALRLAPNTPGFVAAKVELYHMEGEYSKAMQTLEPILKAAPNDASVIGVFATIARQVKRQREAIPMVEQLLKRTDIAPATRIKNSFELGALYDSIGEFDAAFAAYKIGNALKGDRWNPAQHAELVTNVITCWSREALAAQPRAKVDGSRFIFIVGMPRSGTSLVEQIVSAAPSVFGAGERVDLLRVARDAQNSVGMGIPMVWTLERMQTQESVDALGNSYVKAMAAVAGPEYSTVTDKQPLNFVNLGLIQTVLPGAKVIHCRREPMDSCLSCYFQLFAGNIPFAGDLTHCGTFYAEYERMMAHWHAVLDLPILDVQYEELVANQEAITRTILDFLKLPFTQDSLRFHETKRATLTASSQQVREPMYKRSVQRWRGYEKHLGPLRAALGSYASPE
ncbi:MAG: sulfotransferase [Phycisphaerae bacterium]|nr:sulfotransferase [Phycisphaerae bacterium]